MAKDKVKPETENEIDTEAAMAGFGEVDSELTAKAKEVDPFASIPSVVPGKPGFTEGKTLAGIYVRTRKVVSDNFAAGKVDPETGEKYRLLHVLSNRAGDKMFGIWSVGQLGAAMKCLEAGDYIEITYNGVGQPLRKGQTGPHTFKFKGVGKNGNPLVFDWDRINNTADGEEHVPPTAAGVAAPTAHQ